MWILYAQEQPQETGKGSAKTRVRRDVKHSSIDNKTPNLIHSSTQMEDMSFMDYLLLPLSVTVWLLQKPYYCIKFAIRSLKSPYTESIINSSSFFNGMTFFKMNQIMDVAEELVPDEMRYGRGVLGLPFMGLFKDGKQQCTISVCSCCPSIGVIMKQD
jgi:hypothetical protein